MAAPPLFPTFPGLTFPVTRTSMNRAVSSSSVSGKRTSIALMSWPVYRYDMVFSVLHFDSPNDYQTMQGFINSLSGSYGNFYYDDPQFDTATAVEIGTGDGVNTMFQLSADIGGFLEPVQSPVAFSVFLDGVLVNPIDYTEQYGIITFGTPPGVGVVVTWTGTYYQLCYMLNNDQTFDQFDMFRAEITQLSFMTDKL